MVCSANVGEADSLLHEPICLNLNDCFSVKKGVPILLLGIAFLQTMPKKSEAVLE